MKKSILVFSLLTMVFFALEGRAQDENREKHELKLNAFNLIIFKTFDASYEHILNPNASVGISILANLQDKPASMGDVGEWPFYNEQFAITPYYRHFFMNRYAKGFFLEAFGMYNSQERWDRTYDFDGEDDLSYLGASKNLAIGIAVGGKIVSRRNFVFEFFGGVGRNLYESDADAGTGFVPRVGINLGYRF